jgi:hypothetical protein
VAGLVLVGGPEARGVRGADLIAEHERAVLVEPELELRVGEDHAALARVLGDRAVDGERGVPHPLGERAVADQLDGLLEVDRLVVALLGLRRRGVERLRKLVGLAQALRQREPGDRAGPPVVLPARAGQIPAYDALHRQHLQPLHAQGAPAEILRHAVGGGHEVVGDDVLGEVEPQHGQAREHAALVRDRRRVHDVVGRDPVGGDHQQVVPQVVDLADLALGDEGKVGRGGGHIIEASNGFGGSPPPTPQRAR